jgi:hypothetical protein
VLGSRDEETKDGRDTGERKEEGKQRSIKERGSERKKGGRTEGRKKGRKEERKEGMKKALPVSADPYTNAWICEMTKFSCCVIEL